MKFIPSPTTSMEGTPKGLAKITVPSTGRLVAIASDWNGSWPNLCRLFGACRLLRALHSGAAKARFLLIQIYACLTPCKPAETELKERKLWYPKMDMRQTVWFPSYGNFIPRKWGILGKPHYLLYIYIPIMETESKFLNSNPEKG